MNCSLTFVMLFLSSVTIFAADVPASSEFEVAKANYEAEVSKVRMAISESIQKRLAVAQKSGNVFDVNSVMEEQAAFSLYGDIPPSTLPAQRRKLAELAKIMDGAIADELLNLTKAN